MSLPNLCNWYCWSDAYLGPELQCLLKVKQDFSLVLVFQHAILNAK